MTENDITPERRRAGKITSLIRAAGTSIRKEGGRIFTIGAMFVAALTILTGSTMTQPVSAEFGKGPCAGVGFQPITDTPPINESLPNTSFVVHPNDETSTFSTIGCTDSTELPGDDSCFVTIDGTMAFHDGANRIILCANESDPNPGMYTGYEGLKPVTGADGGLYYPFELRQMKPAAYIPIILK